jgi:hypothetical protein
VLDHAMTVLVVGGQPVYLEQDALAFRDGDRLRICEMKSFPIVDGQADPEKAGAAARQTAVYVASIQDTLESMGADPAIVSTEVVLICPRNYSIRPTGALLDIDRELRSLRRQLERRSRVGDILDRLPDELCLLETPDDGDDAEPEPDAAGQVLAQLEPHYLPGCLSRCDLGRLCRAEAMEQDNPARLGDPADTLLGGLTTVAEAVALSNGTEPGDDQTEVAEALRRTRRLLARSADLAG